MTQAMFPARRLVEQANHTISALSVPPAAYVSRAGTDMRLVFSAKLTTSVTTSIRSREIPVGGGFQMNLLQIKPGLIVTLCTTCMFLMFLFNIKKNDLNSCLCITPREVFGTNECPSCILRCGRMINPLRASLTLTCFEKLGGSRNVGIFYRRCQRCTSVKTLTGSAVKC